jgi:hypothetical protein
MSRTETLDLLHCLSFADEKEISVDIFSKYFYGIDQSQSSLWLPSSIEDGPWSANKLADVIRRLKAFSLISSYHEVNTFLHVSIHPLVRD